MTTHGRVRVVRVFQYHTTSLEMPEGEQHGACGSSCVLIHSDTLFY